LRAQTTCLQSLESGLEKGELHHGECKWKWFKESEVASWRVQKNRRVLISNTCDKEKIFYDYCLENHAFW